MRDSRTRVDKRINKPSRRRKKLTMDLPSDDSLDARDL